MDAVKLSEIMYDFEGARYSNYDEELEGYFLMTKIQDNRLWMEDSMDDRDDIGPIKLPQKNAELCQTGMELSGVIARKGDEWFILEAWNVYP